MTSTKVASLKQSLTAHFRTIYELCNFIFQNHIAAPGSVKPSLLRATLDTMSRYLTWIPLGYIFETQLIPILLTHFWDPLEYRLECIKCLNEIACLEGSEMTGQSLPPDLGAQLAAVPQAQRPFWDAFMNQLALLLT